METTGPEAEKREEELRKRIILPYDIPWEAGSNRFASQKGMGGFGTKRDNVAKVSGSRELSESSDAVIPRWEQASGIWKPATQSGQRPFGGIKEHVKKAEENEEVKDVKEYLDADSARFLSRFAQGSDPNLKNDAVGRMRDATIQIDSGKYRRTKGNKVKSGAAIPRLYDTRALNGPAAGSGTGIQGLHKQRQVTTKVDGYDWTMDEVEQSKKITPWTTGLQLHQTQSKTGGFMKYRDVCNKTYYDEKRPRSSYPGFF